MPVDGIWGALLVLACAAAAAMLLGAVSGRATVALARRSERPVIGHLHQECHRAWVATLVALGLLLASPAADLPAAADDTVNHLLVMLLIATTAWLAVKALFVVEEMAFARYRVDIDDNRRARRMRTQIAILRRVTAGTIGVLALASVLTTFTPMRTLGASVLASAGVVGIVAGLAAQTTLGNVFAGIQLAFSGALRLDDVVVVEDEWGRIEELTLTYVVIHLWDERRMVLPTSYFTSTPFQNWTRNEARVLGSALLHLDLSAHVGELREAAERIVAASPWWDRRDWALEVVDATPTTQVVRVLASARDASAAWNLRCEIREKMLEHLRVQHPEALPRVRAEVGDSRAGDDEGRRLLTATYG